MAPNAIIPELDERPTEQERAAARVWVYGYEDGERTPTDIDISNRDAKLRATTARRILEFAAGWFCSECAVGVKPRKATFSDEYVHPIEQQLGEGPWCPATPIWQAIRAHDAAMAEIERLKDGN